MKKKFTKSLGMAALILFAACKKDAQNKDDAMENNIILAEWTGPYQGVPAFNKMKVEMLKPAIMKGMEQHLKEIDSIAGNAEAPTFENTIIPFEKTGAALDRAFTYYGIFSSNLSSPEFREIQ